MTLRAWMMGIAVALAGCSKSAGDGVQEKGTTTSRATEGGAAGGGPAAAPATPAGPFTLELRIVTLHPTCRGNQRIKIDARGDLWSATNTADCPDGGPWSTPYAAAAQRRLGDDERAHLGALVRSSGVLDLPAVSTDPTKATQDGHREELELEVDGRHVVVAVENTDVPAFAEVRQAVLDAASR